VVGEAVPWLLLASIVGAGALALFRLTREELRQAREESRRAAAELREEVARRFAESANALTDTLTGVAAQLKELQEGNERKLDQMRQIIHERTAPTPDVPPKVEAKAPPKAAPKAGATSAKAGRRIGNTRPAARRPTAIGRSIRTRPSQSWPL